MCRGSCGRVPVQFSKSTLLTSINKKNEKDETLRPAFIETLSQGTRVSPPHWTALFIRHWVQERRSLHEPVRCSPPHSLAVVRCIPSLSVVSRTLLVSAVQKKRLTSDSEGQQPMQTRSKPLGLDGLSRRATRIAQGANQHAELTGRFAQQALLCSVHKVATILIIPEDFGGHPATGPSSLGRPE